MVAARTFIKAKQDDFGKYEIQSLVPSVSESSAICIVVLIIPTRFLVTLYSVKQRRSRGKWEKIILRTFLVIFGICGMISDSFHSYLLPFECIYGDK